MSQTPALCFFLCCPRSEVTQGSFPQQFPGMTLLFPMGQFNPEGTASTQEQPQTPSLIPIIQKATSGLPVWQMHPMLCWEPLDSPCSYVGSAPCRYLLVPPPLPFLREYRSSLSVFFQCQLQLQSKIHSLPINHPLWLWLSSILGAVQAFFLPLTFGFFKRQMFKELSQIFLPSLISKSTDRRQNPQLVQEVSINSSLVPVPSCC